MTFDEWYAINIAANLPADLPSEFKKQGREAMAACWNAALDAAGRATRPSPNAPYGLYNPSDVLLYIESLKVSL